MTYQVLFRPEAEDDLRQAYGWYEEQRKGLGDDFLLCVEAVVSAIEENPFQYPVVHGEIRRGIVRRFPYAVFFLCEGPKAMVMAVFHCRRHPRTWHRRGGRKT